MLNKFHLSHDHNGLRSVADDVFYVASEIFYAPGTSPASFKVFLLSSFFFFSRIGHFYVYLWCSFSRYIFVFNDIIHALVGLQRDVGYDVKSSTKTMMTVVFSHAVKPPFIYMIQPIQKKEN